jgi:hypothetical protein
MNGAHRRDGMLVLAGRGVRPAGALPTCEITDVLPTLLALAGLPIPDGLDGRPVGAALATAPEVGVDPLAPVCAPPVPFDAAESRDVAARLAALGYLEPEA